MSGKSISYCWLRIDISRVRRKNTLNVDTMPTFPTYIHDCWRSPHSIPIYKYPCIYDHTCMGRHIHVLHCKPASIYLSTYLSIYLSIYPRIYLLWLILRTQSRKKSHLNCGTASRDRLRSCAGPKEWAFRWETHGNFMQHIEKIMAISWDIDGYREILLGLRVRR